MLAYVLVIVLATSGGERAGATTIQVPQATLELCNKNANVLLKQAQERYSYILSWGCIPTGLTTPIK